MDGRERLACAPLLLIFTRLPVFHGGLKKYSLSLSSPPPSSPSLPACNNGKWIADIQERNTCNTLGNLIFQRLCYDNKKIILNFFLCNKAKKEMGWVIVMGIFEFPASIQLTSTIYVRLYIYIRIFIWKQLALVSPNFTITYF